MSILKRWVVVFVVLALLGGLIELGLRLFMPSLIEGGARMALRVPPGQEVTVSTEGSMLLNALRWRISDVTVTAEGVPLADDISASVVLEVGSMPLFPAIGNLHDGTASFTVSADQLDGLVQVVSRGLAQWAEMRDDELITGGVLTDQQFELPHSPSFEIPYESVVAFDVDNGEIIVTPSDLRIEGQGLVGAFLAETMSQLRAVCFADRLPAGVTLTDIEVNPSGEVALHAVLSGGLISNPDERSRGTCDDQTTLTG